MIIKQFNSIKNSHQRSYLFLFFCSSLFYSKNNQLFIVQITRLSWRTTGRRKISTPKKKSAKWGDEKSGNWENRIPAARRGQESAHWGGQKSANGWQEQGTAQRKVLSCIWTDILDGILTKILNVEVGKFSKVTLMKNHFLFSVHCKVSTID